MEHRSDEASRQKVFGLIADVKVAQMVTVDANGKLRSRPMVAQQQKDRPGELWFFTSASSGKVEEIDEHREVLLIYSDPKSQNYVSLLGDAEVVHDRDKIKLLWSEPVRVWFPKGAGDPDIALIKVIVSEADFWDSPSSTLVHVYGYAKAVITGERPDPGDNRHVDFS